MKCNGGLIKPCLISAQSVVAFSLRQEIDQTKAICRTPCFIRRKWEAHSHKRYQKATFFPRWLNQEALGIVTRWLQGDMQQEVMNHDETIFEFLSQFHIIEKCEISRKTISWTPGRWVWDHLLHTVPCKICTPHWTFSQHNLKHHCIFGGILEESPT